MAQPVGGPTQLLLMEEYAPSPEQIVQAGWAAGLAPGTPVLLQSSDTGVAASANYLWPLDIDTARQMCEALTDPVSGLPPDVGHLDLCQWWLGDHLWLLWQHQIPRQEPSCPRWVLSTIYDDTCVVRMLQLRWGRRLLSVGVGMGKPGAHTQ
jgi:hypothetical protein